MESDLDVVMVGPWMLCEIGWSLIRSGRYHGWHMDALRERMESDLDVIMVGPWMLCMHAWSRVLTLSWLAHGCSVISDGVGTAHASGVGNGCSAPG